ATGRAILIDFGLASALNEERVLPPGYETTTDALHATTLFRGTPAFVAPERLTGGTPTAASDWYSLGATFFFAYTGVHYCAAAPSRMLIQTMPSPWRERFLQLLHTTPEARFQTVTPPLVDPPPAHVKKRWYWAAILSLFLLVLLGAHYHLVRRPMKRATPPTDSPPPTRLFDSTRPLHLKANETQHFTLTSCTLPFLQLDAHAVLTLHLPEGNVALEACDIHPDAKLIFTGKGTLNLHQSEQAKFAGTLQLNDEITLNSHNINTHTTPQLVTSKDTTIIASLGNDNRSMHLFKSIDMSKGGSIIGHGIRFYLMHSPANSILLGNGAILDLPWTSQRACIRCTSGTSELRSLSAHIGGSLWLSAAPDATLKVSGDRLYMFDYWRGDDIFITADNQGTVIFDFRECCPLTSFQLQNGTTIFRCDMTQDVEKNWCHKRWTEDWVLYPHATLKGNTTLTFANNSQLFVCEKATLEAGENQHGALSCNRATLETDARLLVSGNTQIHIDHLTLNGASHILDLKDCTHHTPLSWTTLVGDVSTIFCVNAPKGKRIHRTPTAITLVDEKRDGAYP
ncbi:MAG: hypothetical protein Q4C03_05205, partial [bacterium]|nr:hypothetical protein [bacterium]